MLSVNIQSSCLLNCVAISSAMTTTLQKRSQYIANESLAFEPWMPLHSRMRQKCTFLSCPSSCINSCELLAQPCLLYVSTPTILPTPFLFHHCKSTGSSLAHLNIEEYFLVHNWTTCIIQSMVNSGQTWLEYTLQFAEELLFLGYFWRRLQAVTVCC